MTRFVPALVFAAVIAASGTLAVAGIVAEMPGQPYVLAFLDQFAHALVMTLVVAAIIAACEQWGRHGAVRVLVQGVALVIGVVATAWGVAAFARRFSLIADMGSGSTDGLWPAFTWFGVAASVFFSWYYAVRGRAAAAIDALAEESVLRHAALRRADEARLAALRAQVDPSTLDARLVAIDAAYREGSDVGDRMLDDLIDYLTEALAASRGISKST